MVDRFKVSKGWVGMLAATILSVALVATGGLTTAQAGTTPSAGGDLDPGFGTGGKVLTDLAGNRFDGGNAMLVQPDGKLIVAGGGGRLDGGNPDYTDFALARYNTDGTLDQSFGVSGKVTTAFNDGHYDHINGLALQSDGKIVAAGEAYIGDVYRDGFGLARYNPDGTLDQSFGVGGLVRTYFNDENGAIDSHCMAVGVTPGGKILAVGHTGGALGQDFALVQYNSDGSFDQTFGNGGGETITFGLGYNMANATLIQPDGKILVSGHAMVGTTGNDDFALMRLDANGGLDATFGSGGMVSSDFLGGTDWGYGLALRSDGRIVQDGFAQIANCGQNCRRYTFGLVQYNSNGTLDSSFGTGGQSMPDFIGDAQAYALALVSDGKLAAAGRFGDDFGLALFNANGSLDSTFNGGQIVTTDFGGNDTAHSIAFQADGKVVLVGTGGMDYDNTDFALARYLAGSAPPPPTNTPQPTQTPGGPTATPPSGCALQFSDVPSGSTFYQYVECLACNGIIGGYSDGTFRPSNNVTRGQLSKIIANAANFQETHTEQNFADVSADSTFYQFIERMASRGIIGGYACGGPGEPCDGENRPYFRPQSNATRGQIAKIDVLTAVQSIGWVLMNPPSSTFEDVPSGSTFYQYVETAYAYGVLGGYPCGGVGEPCGPGNKPYFRPNNNASRGQTSKIVSSSFFPNCNAVR
jgi:uncharacterized delta-60 repeat protein